MTCKSCGNSLKDGDKFCPYCGTPVESNSGVNQTINNQQANQNVINQTNQPTQTNNQPQINSQHNNPPNNSNQSGNNTTRNLFIGIIAVGVIISTILGTPSLASDKNDRSSEPKAYDGKTESGTKAVNNKTYTYLGYKLNIPSSCSVSDKNDILVLDDYYNDVIYTFSILKDDFNKYKNNLDAVRTYAEGSNMTVTSITTENISNRTFIIVEGFLEGNSVMMYISDSPYNNVLSVGFSYNSSSPYNHDDFKMIANVLNTMKSDSTTADVSMSVKNIIDSISYEFSSELK